MTTVHCTRVAVCGAISHYNDQGGYTKVSVAVTINIFHSASSIDSTPVGFIVTTGDRRVASAGVQGAQGGRLPGGKVGEYITAQDMVYLAAGGQIGGWRE